MLSQVVQVVVCKEDNWDNHDNFFCNFATQNVEVMDFFERHYKKIAVGWLLLLFLLWLLPRVVGVKNHNFLDPAQAGLLYLILFGIAVCAFVLIAFVEVASSKNYKRLKRMFLVIVVPLMLLAAAGVYRNILDTFVVHIPFQSIDKAMKKGVFYAEYDVIPATVSVNDTTMIRFEEAIGQYKLYIDKSRLFDFPKYIKSDRKYIVINCSCDDMSRSFYHHLVWSSDDAYYIEGPIRYGKKGRPMVEISLKDSASDTILITVGSLHSLEIIDTIPSEKLDTIRLVKRR